jgi:hypothetical protein
MALSPAQIATLKTFVQNSSVPAIVAARTAGATFDLMNLLNADYSPATKGWRFVDKATVVKVWSEAEVNNLTTSNMNAMNIVLTHASGFDCTKSSGPLPITDIWSNGVAPLTRTALLNAALENISVAEQVLGGTSVTSATPQSLTGLVRNWVGDVTQEECQKFLA